MILDGWGGPPRPVCVASPNMMVILKKLTKNLSDKFDGILYNKKGGDGAFTGSSGALKRSFIKKYPNYAEIALSVFQQYLETQAVYGLHKNRRIFFKRNPFYSPSPGYIFGIDLIDYTAFKNENDNHRYILFGVDIFSKMTYGEKLLKKDTDSVLTAFKKMLKNIHHKPNMVTADLGLEFSNKKFLNFLKEKKIYFYTLQGESHGGVIERNLQTIKSKIARFWRNKGSHNWTGILPSIIDSHNNTWHRSIKMAPIEVELWNSDSVHDTLYKKMAKIKGKFKVGDLVRFSYILDSRSKKYEGKWSPKILLITKKFYPTYGHIAMYKLIDNYSKKLIPGSFYSEELAILPKEVFGKDRALQTYDIRVLKTRGKKSLITYVGYGEDENVWVPTSSLLDRKIK